MELDGEESVLCKGVCLCKCDRYFCLVSLCENVWEEEEVAKEQSVLVCFRLLQG